MSVGGIREAVHDGVNGRSKSTVDVSLKLSMDTGQNDSHPLKRVLLVESARGAAAVYVCLHHVILIGHLADSFKWAKFLFYPLSFGQEAVYLFFFLSGFSIHYSSYKRPLETIGGIGHYYYLRFRRIYPIFLIAVGLSIALGDFTSFLGIISNTPCHPSVRDLTYVLFFLSDVHEGSWHSGLANDPALWSLSYEIPYYLVYPFFWMCCKRFGIGRAFAATFFGSGAFILTDCIQANHVSNIFSLYWLWTCGALMAEWKLTNKSFTLSPVAYYFVVSLCYAVSQSTEAVANPVIHWNLQALTIGVVICSTFINFQPTTFTRRLLAAGGIVMLLLVSLLITRNVPTWGRHIFLDARLIFAAAIFALLLITGINIASLCRMLAKPFLKMGAISYAIYVVHMPILYFVVDLFRHTGTSFYWMPLGLLPVFLLAWWLETKFQARVSAWLDSTRAKLAGVAGN
jgi:peptidoglycan/LPS O-acetylase OafA/YrhL